MSIMNEYSNLNIINAYVDDEYLYAVDCDYNIFFRAQRKDNYKVEWLGVINRYKQGKEDKVCAIYRYKDSLFLFSLFSYNVIQYNFNSGNFTYYYPEEDYNESISVQATCRINNEIWIFQNSLESRFCIFSMEDLGYKFFNIDTSEIVLNVKEKDVERITKENIYIVDRKIWRFVPGTNYIYNIKCDTKEIEIYRVDLNIKIFMMDYDGENFILTTMYGDRILLWDPRSGIKDIKIVNYGNKIERAFIGVLHCSKYYILIPAYYYKIILVEENGKVIDDYAFPTQFKKLPNNPRGLFLNYCVANSRILLFPFGGNNLIEIDLDTMRPICYSMCISQNDFIKSSLIAGREILEKNRKSLKSFIFYFDRQDIEAKNIINSGEVGKRLFLKIKE